ncbi:hypothetical protein TSUD_136140 [Trifolium subterraneum]|uniref:Uncharacterized protein n=1 Tax=Trifolium subterraneum TaxID=3900 RepID=A0A2Z6P1M0_TRISU|nr:hypothetical protein TSUD_136140 [Trifolium subterraneum]
MPSKKNTTPHAMEVRLENLELTMEARLQTLEHKKSHQRRMRSFPMPASIKAPLR